MDATERAVLDELTRDVALDLAVHRPATRADVEAFLVKSGLYKRRLFVARLRELVQVMLEPFRRLIER